jgi:hypothetical protein
MEKHRYRIVAPQEYEQAFYVTATSSEEALELVSLTPEEANARGAELESCVPEFVSSCDPETWLVERVEREAAVASEGSPPKLHEGLSREAARFLALDKTEAWDLKDIGRFVMDTLIQGYLSDPKRFYEEWYERFDRSPGEEIQFEREKRALEVEQDL